MDYWKKLALPSKLNPEQSTDQQNTIHKTTHSNRGGGFNETWTLALYLGWSNHSNRGGFNETWTVDLYHGWSRPSAIDHEIVVSLHSNIFPFMGFQSLNSTTASAPRKAKIFIHRLPERSREITRAVFVNSLHIKLKIAIMVIGGRGSAETPREGLMIHQLRYFYRCRPLPLRRRSDELAVIIVALPSISRTRTEALWESHRCPRRPRNANVATIPGALSYFTDIEISGSGQKWDRRQSFDTFIERSLRPCLALCIRRFAIWSHLFHDKIAIKISNTRDSTKQTAYCIRNLSDIAEICSLCLIYVVGCERIR